MKDGPLKAGGRAAERAAQARQASGSRPMRPVAAARPGAERPEARRAWPEPAPPVEPERLEPIDPAPRNAFAQSAPREWPSDRWNTLSCLATWKETHDVRTFLLAPADGSRIRFEAGQFMTFRFGALVGKAPEALERSYTISSSAARERAITITVKKKFGGAVSGILHDKLIPGASIAAYGPSGRFSPSQYSGTRLCLLSGGVGVTPMLSTVRTAADLGIDLDAVFVHAARTPRDIIAAAELQFLARSLPKLRVLMVPTKPYKRWSGPSGLIDASRLNALVPDLASREVMCCGPAPFMAAMRAACLSAGVPETGYGEESFDFSIAANEPEPVAELGGPSRLITFAKTGRSFECPSGFTILQAARRAGIPMAASCAKGICGTCKCRKVSGQVIMDHGGGIRDREVARGLILPCSSYAETDIVLDR